MLIGEAFALQKSTPFLPSAAGIPQTLRVLALELRVSLPYN
jgi:hypothetical protein